MKKRHFHTKEIRPSRVIKTLGRHILADGFHIVVDLDRSRGSYMVDQVSGRKYLDMYTYYSTAPLGHNHPKMTDRQFLEDLKDAGIENPANSDVYSVEFASFVNAFEKIAMPEHMKYLFFITGGALAVENGLKTAFDWKVRKNMAAGRKGLGSRVIHFREAFHGRSGYTLSLTNTSEEKTKYFPRFKWPRIPNPKLSFPVTEKVLRETEKAEEKALGQIRREIKKHGKDIACLIIEPIQGEGGDNHFRGEFLKALEEVCRKHDIMYMLDEVQTGTGTTGKMWAFQHFGLKPDIVAFGKKAQVCGIMVSKRVDEVKNNVFHESSRINSTWGGSLSDMVRGKRVLEIIHEEKLVKNAARTGAYFLERLEELQSRHEEITNVRGRGMFIAFDLPTGKERDRFRERCWKNGLAVLKSWPRSIRFRPPLTLSKEEADEAIERLEKSFS